MSMIAILGCLGFVGFLSFLISIKFRRVVSTNMVHIVQSRRKTTPYGTGQVAGNVYYAWPSAIPMFGVTVIRLPISNFDISLESYDAYDRDRVPFMVDVTAFFRIEDAAKAAQRISSFEELKNQATVIVRGAVRKVLASGVIDTIMVERSQFGDAFTAEVRDQLQEWGLEAVKSMELMDLRDCNNSNVVENIMAKKTSQIQMESRREVANNNQTAETAEIEAKRSVEVCRQEAEEKIGQRTAEKDRAIGIANQQAQQDVLAQSKLTKQREMDVASVLAVRTAEIEKEQKIVAAEQEKRTRVIIAEGELDARSKEAEAIKTIGEAKATAESAMQMVPVNASIALAKEIGANDGYQRYLVSIEAIKAHIQVGVEQAKALQRAEVKVISNAGSPGDGVKGVMELFSSRGGTELGSMIEGLAQTPMGQAILSALGVNPVKPVTSVVSDPVAPKASE